MSLTSTTNNARRTAFDALVSDVRACHACDRMAHL
jgi:hypothetical protein